MTVMNFADTPNVTVMLLEGKMLQPTPTLKADLLRCVLHGNISRASAALY